MSTINHFKSGFDDTRETVTVNGRIAIREALPGLDFENSVISVNGFEADENYILQKNDICAIRTFPKGAPGSSPLEITLGILTLGVYTACDAIVAGATGKTIGHHLQNALMNWLAQDAPNANNGGTDSGLANIPQLRGAKNQSNKNRPIPIVMGKHLFTPMYIGSPYTGIDGEDGEEQYFTALYLLGWGKLEVSDIRLGPVSGLAKNADRKTDDFLLYDKNDKFCDPGFADSNPQLELRQGPNPGRPDGEVGLYPQRVVEERLSIELMNVEGNNPLEAIRFSAQDPLKVQIEFTFNNGLVSYDDKGNKKDASVGIKVEWRDKPGEDPDGGWKEFGRIGTNGGHSPTSYDSATRTTTITRKKNKVMRFTAERFFAYDDVKDAAGRTLELRIVRTTPQPTDSNRTADTVFLTAIRTWCFDNDTEVDPVTGRKAAQAPMIQKYRDKTARLGFRIKAAENLQGTIDALNCMVTSYARTWNGSDWNDPETPASNPASVALKILQSPALGNNAYPDSMLDLDSFGEFYEWCAEREYTCNGVLTAEKRVDDLLNAVPATGRGMRILNGSRYAVLIDKPRENPVTILNSQNVLDASNQKTFEDLPDGFSVKFVNELDGYQETEVYVAADGSARPGPMSRIEPVEMPFVTDYRQAIKNGRYMLACRRLRPEIWNRKLSVDGYLIGIGDLVEVQDDTILVGIGEGAVIKGLRIENGVITEIQTDGVFDVVDMSKTYGLKIMQFDGINPGKARTIRVEIPEPGVYRDFAVSIPVSDRPVPGTGDIVAFGIYDRITTPAICFGKKPNGDGTFDVALIPYQEGIYTTDSGEIPPYRTNITAPQGLAPLAEIPPDPVSRGDMLEAISEIDLSVQTSVVYELRPSVSVIRKDNDGAAVPGAVSCSQIMIEGNSPPVPSNKTLSYITSENSAAVLYTGPVPVGSWDWIEFILSDRGMELDRETVHVLRDGSDAVVLDIENQNYPVFCRHDGQPKEGELPFSVQATLYLGTGVVTGAFWSLAGAPRGVTINQGGLITAAAEYRYISDIPRYPVPGEGGEADPMPGPFYPCPPESEWPVAQTVLGTSAEITVRALFRGQAYTRKLRIRKILDGAPGEPGEKGDQGEQGDPAPRYLGKTVTKTTSNTVFIRFTSAYSANVAANVGDYVLYIGASEAGASLWKKNFLLQWNGAQWIQLDPLSSAYTDYYMGALRDMEGEELGAFNVLFAQKIMAMEATIETLQAKILKLYDPNNHLNYIELNGQQGVIKSAGFTGIDGTTLGFLLRALDGLIEANNIKTRNMKAVNADVEGKINATSGSFTGEVNADSGWFDNGVFGNIILKNIVLNANGEITSTKYIIRAPLDGALLQGIYGTAGFAAALDNYFGEAKNKYITTEFKCSGTVYLSGGGGNAYGLIIANMVAWASFNNSWYIRGSIISGNIGETGNFINLNLGTYPNRSFILNLCLG